MTCGHPNIAASIVQQNGMTAGDTPLVATADDAIGTARSTAITRSTLLSSPSTTNMAAFRRQASHHGNL